MAKGERQNARESLRAALDQNAAEYAVFIAVVWEERRERRSVIEAHAGAH